MSRREMSVAGTFYPRSCEEIKRYIQTFDEALNIKGEKVPVRGIISPHAGYVYSGFTANAAYGLIDTKEIKRVVIIGPSHRVYLRGASVALYDEYLSPCSNLKIDLPYSQRLLDKYGFLSFEPTAHAEHSTETQVPFVEHYFSSVSLVEIVYGDLDYRTLVPLIESALANKENFVIISTDLSHFFSLEDAKKLDEICLEGIKAMDLAKMDAGCQACGMIGVKAMLQASLNRGLKSRLIDYRTSYDASSDESSVVGYMSALIG